MKHRPKPTYCVSITYPDGKLIFTYRNEVRLNQQERRAGASIKGLFTLTSSDLAKLKSGDRYPKLL